MMQKFKFLSKDKKGNSTSNHKENLNDDSSAGSERRVVSRNAVICSSGKDKYRYDSERAEVPNRPVDAELEYAPLSPASSSVMLNNHLSPSYPRSHSSQLTIYGSHDLASSMTSLSRDSVSQVVKRDAIVKQCNLQPSVFVNGKFQNPWPNYKMPTFTNILKLGLSHDKSSIPSKHDLNQSLPLLEPNIKEKPPENAFRLTWIGHATVLAEFDNISFLTDPIFSERASPSQVIGPKRYREPPCTIHDLPSNLDAVVISHSHYDHLDLNTVVMLNARYGNDLRWFIPLGLADWFGRLGCENVIELDWWEENCVLDKSDVSFVLTPCQHWSKRTLTDDNKSLWGSWVVKGPRFKFFFAGDTGYCDIFKQIGQMYGPFDVAAIPIGSYEPRAIMKCQHINPVEAVKLHKDIRSKFSLAVHWGTFALSNEHFLEPPQKLNEALDKARVSRHRFVTFMHGETRIITANGRVETTPHHKIL